MSYTPYSGPEGSNYIPDTTPPKPEDLSRGRHIPLGLVVAGVLVIALAGLIAGLAIGHKPDPTQGLKEEPQLGSLAPNFELRDVRTGKALALSSLRGKPVWINFWATWCDYCKQEMPEMQKYLQQYKDKGLVILGVDAQENQSAVQRYITNGGYSWTFVIDPAGQVLDKYLVDGLPSHFFVDPDGIIRAIHIGALENIAGRKAPIEDYLSRIIK